MDSGQKPRFGATKPDICKAERRHEKRRENVWNGVGEMKAPNANTPGLAPSSGTDEILEKPETAERLKISTRTLDVWMRDGRIPFLKIGKSVRFRWADVMEKLAAHRVN